QLFYNCISNECKNIVNEKTPATNSENLTVKLQLTEVLLEDITGFLLISRAMPQSITNAFLENFQMLSSKAKYTPQNLKDITLYKDKAIPYLLQENEENMHIFTMFISKNAKRSNKALEIILMQ
ncbi:MAG: hypothetical protein O3A66_00075, partial [Proteobacteria bacterium]|nr:hypothetical protein [Pseudomonadota bacterium]